MAYESLKGVRLSYKATGQTFIFSDKFVVFTRNNENPRVYNWSDIIFVSETRTMFTINTNDITYSFNKSCIDSDHTLLKIRAIIEGSLAKYPDTPYVIEQRILPSKQLYENSDIDENAYVSSGYYDEKEINEGNIAITCSRPSHLVFFGIIVAVVIYFILFSCTSEHEYYWIYFIPISAFIGCIAASMIYLLALLVAKFRFSDIYKIDPAIIENITFVVNETGFSAVESFLYTGCDIVPWEKADYYIETNSLYMFMIRRKAICWLPKNVFTADQQRELDNFIRRKLKQK